MLCSCQKYTLPNSNIELILINSHDVTVETIQFHIFPTFYFFMQKLINMKMYDKQLYPNVEDLPV